MILFGGRVAGSCSAFWPRPHQVIHGRWGPISLGPKPAAPTRGFIHMTLRRKAPDPPSVIAGWVSGVRRTCGAGWRWRGHRGRETPPPSSCHRWALEQMPGWRGGVSPGGGGAGGRGCACSTACFGFVRKAVRSLPAQGLNSTPFEDGRARGEGPGDP